MRLALLGSVTSIALLAATPSYAWERIWILIQGGVWNGPAATGIGPFYTKEACEAAAAGFEANGRSALTIARPGLTKQGIAVAFWHNCAPSDGKK